MMAKTEWINVTDRLPALDHKFGDMDISREVFVKTHGGEVFEACCLGCNWRGAEEFFGKGLAQWGLGCHDDDEYWEWCDDNVRYWADLPGVVGETEPGCTRVHPDNQGPFYATMTYAEAEEIEREVKCDKENE